VFRLISLNIIAFFTYPRDVGGRWGSTELDNDLSTGAASCGSGSDSLKFLSENLS